MIKEERFDEKESKGKRVAGIAVIGAGWWGQARHLPQLHNNPRAKIIAIVEPNQSTTQIQDNLQVEFTQIQDNSSCYFLTTVVP